jgi:hypothetical protein
MSWGATLVCGAAKRGVCTHRLLLSALTKRRERSGAAGSSPQLIGNGARVRCRVDYERRGGVGDGLMLLARRFTLNSVLVVIALIFWYWMWGVPGAILAVPMLAITKIVCDRIRTLAAFGHFLEG